MSNLSDDLAAGSIVGMIFGLPIFIGIAILAIPFLIISCITDVPMLTLMQNLLAFVIAVFFVWLFSKHQIIENGIVGLIAGSAIHTYFKWHPVACILIGIAVVGLLFFISNIKIGFWIKTILFSLIVTFMVFMCIYSDMGLLPLPDMIWKVAFFIVFFLGNIFIRCAVAHDNGFLFSESSKSTEERYRDWEEDGTGSFNYNENQPNSFGGAGINNAEEYQPDNHADDTNAEQEIKHEYEQSMKPFNDNKELSTKDNLELNPNDFVLKTGIWDSNAERKAYFALKLFINENYIIIPHVAFQDVFSIKKDTMNISDIQNQIRKYHFDFVVFDSNFLPVLLIEINGRYHTHSYKKNIDTFKRQLVSLCDGLQLIEIDFFESNNDEELKETIEKSLYGHITSRNKYPAYCPVCYSKLKYLYRTDGTAAFYMCPKCRKKNQPEKNRTYNEDTVFPLLKGMR